MAFPGTFKALAFKSPQELQQFVSGNSPVVPGTTGINPPASQAVIVSITFDASSGKYVLFYVAP